MLKGLRFVESSTTVKKNTQKPEGNIVGKTENAASNNLLSLPDYILYPLQYKNLNHLDYINFSEKAFSINKLGPLLSKSGMILILIKYFAVQSPLTSKSISVFPFFFFFQ